MSDITAMDVAEWLFRVFLIAVVAMGIRSIIEHEFGDHHARIDRCEGHIESVSEEKVCMFKGGAK